MYYINQAALENISYFVPVSACRSCCMNMHMVGFANSIIWRFLWWQRWLLIKLCQFYTSISQGNKTFHNLDRIKYILGKITGNYIHTCKLSEISRNVLFQSNSQALNSRKSEVKVSMYKSDFYTGLWNILDCSPSSQFNHKVLLSLTG